MGSNDECFGRDDVGIEFDLTKGCCEVIIHEINLSIGEADTKAVDILEVSNEGITEEDFWFQFKLTINVVGSTVCIDHEGRVEDESIVLAGDNDDCLRIDKEVGNKVSNPRWEGENEFALVLFHH